MTACRVRWAGCCFVVLTLSLALDLAAAPMQGVVRRLEQPDGTIVSVRLWGDEFYTRMESLDGYTLVRDETGFLSYARLTDDGTTFASTGVPYGTALPPSNFLETLGRGLGLIEPEERPDVPRRLHESSSLVEMKANATRAALRPAGGRRRRVSRSQPNLLSSFPAEPCGIDAYYARLYANPPIGDVRGVTLLIDFSDEPASVLAEQVSQFLNLHGYSGDGNAGSVRDYFSDVSGGAIDYTNVVTAYFRAPHDRAYYEDESVGYPTRARELVRAALEHLEMQGFDFSQLSTDDSGCLYAVNAFYAGLPWKPNKGLWAHNAWLAPDSTPAFAADGVTATYYQISDIGDPLSLQTICHENGHMLFLWPDLYDPDLEQVGPSAGTGAYDLMSDGRQKSYQNPLPPGAPLRAWVGWATPHDVTRVPSGTELELHSNSLESLVYVDPSTTQLRRAFYVESRQKIDRSAHLPDDGVIIWHFDDAGDNRHEQMTPEKHYYVSVEQADGRFHLERKRGRNVGDGGDAFGAGARFADDTLPDARWWNGQSSGFSLQVLGPPDSVVRVRVGR